MRIHVYLAAVVGASGVLTGAFGAHWLKSDLLAWGTLSIWQTAVNYQLLHAPALLAASLLATASSSSVATTWLTRACLCWSIGIVLFSGSLYALALGGPHWLGPITPLGGLSLIAGWLCVMGAVPKRPATPAN